MSTSTSAARWSAGSVVERGEDERPAARRSSASLDGVGAAVRRAARSTGTACRGVLVQVVGQRVGPADLARAAAGPGRR